MPRWFWMTCLPTDTKELERVIANIGIKLSVDMGIDEVKTPIIWKNQKNCMSLRSEIFAIILPK